MEIFLKQIDESLTDLVSSGDKIVVGVSGGAGISDHIHFHVVPRWVGDTNFMPVFSHTKVMVDGLLETYDKLKIEFNKLK